MLDLGSLPAQRTGPARIRERAGLCVLVVILTIALTACSTTAQTVGLVAAIGTWNAARSPSNEIEQTYYLGVFDPQDQVPPTVYRVRVHGQASALSTARFASGWVPANVLDALGTGVEFEKDSSRIRIERTQEPIQTYATGRGLMQFGPEGFREAPRAHRLVIVMGASPEKFFQAIDQSLGLVAQVKQGRGGEQFDRLLFEALVKVRNERTQIEEMIGDARAQMATVGVKK